MEQVKYDGTPVTLGGMTYIAPPMSIKIMRKMLPKLDALKNITSPTLDDFDTVTELIHETLRRNYPDLTRDEVEDTLDVKNMRAVIDAILDASGLVRGNAAAATAQQTENSTSTGLSGS